MTKGKNKNISLAIEIPKGDAFAYETDPLLPKCHQQVLCNGARGSGKTVAVVNLIKKLNYDRIFLVSPTAKSNNAILSMLAIDPEDMYEDTDDITIVEQIKEKILEEAELYDKYHKEMERYKQFQKYLNKNLTGIPNDLLFEFYDFSTKQFKNPPEHWLNGRRPMMCILWDDILGSKLFSKGIRSLNNLAILHRHLAPVEAEGGGALGVSNYFLTQSYTIQTGGISKAIRNNCTSLILFRTKNEKEYQQIEDEIAGEVGKEVFKKVYDYAVDEPHSFLFVDLHPKKEHPSKFRKRFEEFILPEKL